MVKKRVKKTAKRKEEAKRPGSFGISLILVLVFFFVGFSQMIYLIIQRLGIIINYGITGNIGILISSILFLVYAGLLAASAILIITRKKTAIKMSMIAMCQMIVVALWFNVIGVLIFYQERFKALLANIPYFIINLAIAIAVISYFARSKKARKVLSGN